MHCSIEVGDLQGLSNSVSSDVLTDAMSLVKGTNEATMDSNLLLKASMKSAMLARAMKSGGGAFDADDFVTKLITFMGGRRAASLQEGNDEDLYDDDEADGVPLDWERIGWKAMAKSRRVPVMDFMCVLFPSLCHLRK